MTTYPDSVRFLYSLGNEVRTIKLGLDRSRSLLARMGNPERKLRFVHVAGTNGKGSVSAMVESGLRLRGARTGLFTSPHLIEPTERIQIAGRPVTEQQFVRAFETVHRTAEQMYRRGRLDVHPTYFETVTAMAFVLFRDLQVETAVLEVGLGGRLDATNVVTPEVCVITRVDYDHEKYLGNSLESIAGEKAGICKPGVPVVIAPQRPEVEAVLRNKANEAGAPVIRAADWAVRQAETHQDGSRFVAATADGEMAIECPLAGGHQLENALTAAVVMRELGFGAAEIQRGIREVRWPGRLERVWERPEVILDGAHNPGGIRALAGHIKRFYSSRRVWIVYGSMRDKSLDEIAGVLSPLASELVLTNVNSHRALRPAFLRQMFEHANVRLAEDLDDALRIVDRDAGPDDVVFVTGSLWLVGDARKRLLAGTAAAGTARCPSEHG